MDEHKIKKSDSEWAAELTREQYRVCRQKETEPPFSGALYLCQEDGDVLLHMLQQPAFWFGRKIRLR